MNTGLRGEKIETLLMWVVPCVCMSLSLSLTPKSLLNFRLFFMSRSGHLRLFLLLSLCLFFSVPSSRWPHSPRGHLTLIASSSSLNTLADVRERVIIHYSIRQCWYSLVLSPSVCFFLFLPSLPLQLAYVTRGQWPLKLLSEWVTSD